MKKSNSTACQYAQFLPRTMTLSSLLYLLCTCFLLLIFSLEVRASTKAEPSESGVCLINDAKGRILMIDELIIDKLALPGGYINGDESPAQAAKRETYEETGIVVTVNEELIRIGKAVIFACHANEPIALYELSSSLALIPFWQASAFSSEMQAAYFVLPNATMQLNARFPAQVALYRDFLNLTKPSQTISQTDFSALYNNASNYSFWLQSEVQKLPEMLIEIVDKFLVASSWFGSFELFFLLLPIAFATGGIQRAVQLIFGALVIASMTILIKMQFAIPRPLYLFPELYRADKWTGFSFTSMHSAIAFFTWFLIYFWYKFNDRSAVYICLLPGILTGISRIYLGANFIIDIFVGALLGIIVAIFAMQVDQKGWLFKAPLWAGFGLIMAILGITTQLNLFLYFTVFCVSYAVILTKFGQREIEFSTYSKEFNTRAFIWSLFSILSLWLVFDNISAITTFKTQVLIGQSISVILLTIWLSFLTPRVSV